LTSKVNRLLIDLVCLYFLPVQNGSTSGGSATPPISTALQN